MSCLSEEDKQLAENMVKKGLMDPLNEMKKELEAKNDLREKTTEARYELTQHKLDSILEKLDRLLEVKV